jgi:hypothetical protein
MTRKQIIVRAMILLGIGWAGAALGLAIGTYLIH